MGVLIGIDPHKSVNAAAAIDDQGELAGHETFPANQKGLRALERWAKRFPERRWAVEGAAGIGRPVAQRLAMAGEKVVDVSLRETPARTTVWTRHSPLRPPCRTSGWPWYYPRTQTTLTSRSSGCSRRGARIW